MDRDCENCIHRVPVFDKEQGIWTGANCDSFDCEFVSRQECLNAWKEKNGND